jgi:competence protein ComEC
VRPISRLSEVIDHQRGHLFPWLPVAYGIGIGIYFGLGSEPGRGLWVGLALALVAGGVLALTRLRHSVLLLAGLAMLAGLGVAGLRTAMVTEPALAFRYYGPIEGRIVGIDRSQSDKPRLTLDRVVLKDVAPDRTPARVRVSLHGEQRWVTPEPGLTVILTGHLSAPEGPVEPGGFDFQRQAFFSRLGAVGYTRTPVLALRPAEEGRAGLFVYRTRMAITAAVIEGVPGRAGAFAAAITTGDRAAIDEPTMEALRASNLAHLLAISGLHMGLLTAFVFASVRIGIAAVPWLALRVPGKKVAAVVALAAGALYLALSGGIVATERAFIMVAVVLTAVLFDRRALTLRAVAMAALIVLTLRPEALTQPGFQMSFAATIALIAAFARIRDMEDARFSRWVQPVFALFISSAVAGLATAPIAASHFNQVPHYGLIANMLAVPVMGTVIMPAAVLAAVLAPIGLHGIGLAIMRPAIEWILIVAEWVAGMEGALSFVPQPQPVVVPVLVLGGLWLVLWQGRARIAGVVPMAAALLIWAQVQRPDAIVSPTGGLVGLMTAEGRVLSKPRGDGFAAESWLESDGDPVPQDIAAARAGFGGGEGWLDFAVGDVRAVHLSGRGAADRVGAACAEAAIVIIAAEVAGPEGCTLLDGAALSETGAVALFAGDKGVRLVTARERVGRRPWNSQ